MIIIAIQLFCRLKERYRFGNKTEEEVYFEVFYEKINQWRKHSYIKIPNYTIDVKKFHPYLQELRNNVFKFKEDDILQARTLAHNMKRKFIRSSKVYKPYRVLMLIQEMFILTHV